MSEIAVSEISCPICLEIYDFPKVLVGGHSFCETCILPLISQGGGVECPECRRKVAIPSEGLATNFAMNRLVELGVNRVPVIKSEMPVEMESMAKRVVMNAINKDQQSSDVEAAHAIISKFNTKYGGNWQCFVGNKGSFDGGLMSKEYICLEVGSKIIHLFKARREELCWKCDGVSCDGGTNCKLGEPKRDENQYGRTKDNEMMEEAKRITIKAIKEQMSPFEAASFIREHFDQKYGKYWICNISKMPGEDGGTSFTFIREFYMWIKVGSINVEIWKPPQKLDSD